MNKIEIKRRIDELYKIQNQIAKLEDNNNKKYKNVKIDDINKMNMEITLKQFGDKIESLGKEAPNFILARNDIILGQ